MVWGGGSLGGWGCICGICLGLWCALAGSTCQCVAWVFADVQWGMLMYTESHCVAPDHNLVDLWFLSLHCCFLLCIGDILEGMVVCIASFLVFIFFYSLIYVFLGFMVVVFGCSWGLLSTLDYVLTLSGPGGGGGSEARMAKLTAANQKPLIL